MVTFVKLLCEGDAMNCSLQKMMSMITPTMERKDLSERGYDQKKWLTKFEDEVLSLLPGEVEPPNCKMETAPTCNLEKKIPLA